MKLARFRWQNEIVYGSLEGDTILSVSGDIFGEFKVGDPLCKVRDVHLLWPVKPSIIVGIGLNYEETIRAYNMPSPKEPMLFLKSPSSVVGHLDRIVYPTLTKDLCSEGELAVIIGKPTKLVSESEANGCILGYTCANDLTARDLYNINGNLARSKNCDTFCPFGPFISIGISGDNLRLKSRVNGQLRQDGYTGDMIFGVSRIVSYISQFMTLRPGDLILTGTPAGAGAVTVGDVLEVEIEGIGTLQNEVVAAE